MLLLLTVRFISSPSYAYASAAHRDTNTCNRKANVSPPISFAAYKAWLASLTGQESDTGVSQAGESASLESDKHTPASTSASASSEPAYPTSFAHIVELITTGQPIPGIEEIPDTVLEGHDLVTEKPRRRKPWEKDEIVAPAEVDETETETTTSAV
jgi:hypothetical protein